MQHCYLDNASTTAIRPEVIQEMLEVMQHHYGNPSSTHSLGRTAKSVVEIARKSIAKQFNVSAQEIIFTSGGTEGNNWILRTAVKDLKVVRIITSKMEHHAVLHAAMALQHEFNIQIDYVKTKINGDVDLTHLSELLSQGLKTIVSLMHVNNETGTVLDLSRVSVICKEHSALFHSDTVQSVGKENLDLQEVTLDFITASAHKFHGPKGIGFIFVRKNTGIQPLFYGGEQEKGLRSGTEATHQIAGMAKALTLSYSNLLEEKKYILNLKEQLVLQLKIAFPDIKINGNGAGFYTILNVLIPSLADKTALILFHLDMKGIAVSRGSACQSGSIKASHVLAEFLTETELKMPSLRISLSHYNTVDDINIFVEALKSIL